MDTGALEAAIARRKALPPLDPAAASLDRAIAGCVPSLLAELARLRGERENERQEWARAREAERLAGPWWGWLL